MSGIFKFQSAINFPDQFLRHFNNEGELSQFDPTRADDFRFKLEDGPERPFGGTSFPTVRFNAVNAGITNKYLRHKNFRLLLEAAAPGDDPQFLEDSIFFELPGLKPSKDKSRNELNSYLSVNFANEKRYIRHIDFHFFIDVAADEDEQAKADATLLKVP